MAGRLWLLLLCVLAGVAGCSAGEGPGRSKVVPVEAGGQPDRPGGEAGGPGREDGVVKIPMH